MEWEKVHQSKPEFDAIRMTPDIVLTIGHRLVVIEAKYESAMSNLSSKPNELIVDPRSRQLISSLENGVRFSGMTG